MCQYVISRIVVTQHIAVPYLPVCMGIEKHIQYRDPVDNATDFIDGKHWLSLSRFPGLSLCVITVWPGITVNESNFLTRLSLLFSYIVYYLKPPAWDFVCSPLFLCPLDIHSSKRWSKQDEIAILSLTIWSDVFSVVSDLDNFDWMFSVFLFIAALVARKGPLGRTQTSEIAKTETSERKQADAYLPVPFNLTHYF